MCDSPPDTAGDRRPEASAAVNSLDDLEFCLSSSMILVRNLAWVDSFEIFSNFLSGKMLNAMTDEQLNRYL